MSVRIQRGFLVSGLGLALCGALIGAFIVGIGVFGYYWFSYGHMIDERLSGHIYQTTARIYTAPERISVGEALAPTSLIEDLQRAGYNEGNVDGAPGWYSVKTGVIEIHPLKDSYFGAKNALHVEFGVGQIKSIRSLDDGSARQSAEIEPELVTNLFDNSREKRRSVRFEDLPPVLVNALLSAEDKRFFEHPGFDIIRIMGAAWADLRHDAIAQGASTLTMQVSRSFFFTTDRTWKRKIAETVVSLELEHRFTKQQIFELYANEIYLGNRGSFAIHGFAEGALAYFNKDVRDLSLNQAAFLTGIIRAPNRYTSADQRPDRAADARDRVLNQMYENGFITSTQMSEAKKAPLGLVPGGLNNSDAPYFVDMVKEHLLDRYSENDLLSQSFRIYTTMDPGLERAATDAITVGVANVDQQLARKYARWKKQGHPAQAQVALIALDPRTGEIRAVVGGRDYGESQLNHVLARRQPGSVFKPFVYAAAFDSGTQGQLARVVTPATMVDDEPTTFDFDGKEYTPNNYGQEFHGEVSLRDALTLSLNVATVKVAEMIGYDRVVDMARQLGLDDDIQATPAVALGAYEMTPLEVAAGYTVFANGGTRAEPMFIDRVVTSEGKTLEQGKVQTHPALDPRVAYQVTSVLEDVIDRGTGATVRARGFQGPAAGKTGTSRDGWFAGYTSNLLCIVWVGFDDNRELGLSGALSAAPIWAEFMKRATMLPGHDNLQEFQAPDGVTEVQIDPTTMQLATPNCPTTRKEVFITGTQPTEYCELHGGRLANLPGGSWLSRVFGGHSERTNSSVSLTDPNAPPPEPAAPDASVSATADSTPDAAPHTAARVVRKRAAAAAPPPPPPAEEKKPTLMDRFLAIFGSSKSESGSQNKRSPNPGH